MAQPADISRPIDLRKRASLGARDARQRDQMVSILLVFFVGLIVLLSLDFTTNPPTFQPLVLLFGLLVAGIIWLARTYAAHGCPMCGRRIPLDSVFCPYCGQRLP